MNAQQIAKALAKLVDEHGLPNSFAPGEIAHRLSDRMQGGSHREESHRRDSQDLLVLRQLRP